MLFSGSHWSSCKGKGDEYCGIVTMSVCDNIYNIETHGMGGGGGGGGRGGWA